MPYPTNRPWRRSPLPPGWGRLRLAILERDAYTCQLHYEHRCIVRATEVDHIDGHDDHRPENLQAVCQPCHATKTGRDNAARTNGPPRQREKPAHPGLIDG